MAAPIPLVSSENTMEPILNKMLYVKPSIAHSMLAPSQTAVAGPSSKPAFKPTSKPVSSAPVDIDPQCQRHADTLRRLGIKTRDFAYESSLPPVRAYHRRQIQPSVPSKRTRMSGDDDESSGHSSEGGSKKKAKLEREDTEPNIQGPTLSRARVFMNLDDYDPEPLSQSQNSGWEASQRPSPFFESQDSEPYIDTPLVTPNGSLQWNIKNTSDIPTSQLDAESQAHEPEFFSCSQLQPARDTTGTGLFGALSPMSSLSSIVSDVSTKLFSKSLHPQPSTHTHAPIVGSPLRATPMSPAPSSRYTLRRRAPAKYVESLVKAGTRTRRTMYAAVQPISRRIAHSMQSSHFRKAKTASSSTRALRARGATVLR
ncbi:hypothetical protein DXG03_000225 [Asterophora parasitica]|uniref:Uncharacterized protein n=1 Tax=Asterophora parasitica TaxID=117018 RepID=A0A9P7GF90_9AGAR|nr:hypothetical protein DXG03_000225 [Asterophora parasitica]